MYFILMKAWGLYIRSGNNDLSPHNISCLQTTNMVAKNASLNGGFKMVELSLFPGCSRTKKADSFSAR